MKHRHPRHGKGKMRKRGAHKNARSPKVLAYNETAFPPERPAWMTAETYQALVAIRAGEPA